MDGPTNICAKKELGMHAATWDHVVLVLNTLHFDEFWTMATILKSLKFANQNPCQHLTFKMAAKGPEIAKNLIEERKQIITHEGHPSTSCNNNG